MAITTPRRGIKDTHALREYVRDMNYNTMTQGTYSSLDATSSNSIYGGSVLTSGTINNAIKALSGSAFQGWDFVHDSYTSLMHHYPMQPITYYDDWLHYRDGDSKTARSYRKLYWHRRNQELKK